MLDVALCYVLAAMLCYAVHVTEKDFEFEPTTGVAKVQRGQGQGLKGTHTYEVQKAPEGTK